MSKLPKLTIEDMAIMMADGDFYTASELGRNKQWLDARVDDDNLPKATWNKVDFYHRPSLEKLVETRTAEPEPTPVFDEAKLVGLIDKLLTEKLGFNAKNLKPVGKPVKSTQKRLEHVDSSIYITADALGKKYGIPGNTVAAWCRDGKIPSKFGKGGTPQARHWVNPNDQKVIAYVTGYPARKAAAANIIRAS